MNLRSREAVLAVLDLATESVHRNESISAAKQVADVRHVVEQMFDYQERLREHLVHEVEVRNRMGRLLASISGACAPDDVLTPDGATMRFVPPEPELHWRALSNAVKAIKEEMHAIFATEQPSRAAALQRIDVEELVASVKLSVPACEPPWQHANGRESALLSLDRKDWQRLQEALARLEGGLCG